MRAIWKGPINFGLVSIPVAVCTAVREEGIKFRMLRADDKSPIRFKRVAEADGKEVPFDKIVKGYEYVKDEFVIVTDEDFDRVETTAAKTITIESFVDAADVNPMHFHKPYYLEPQKGADHAYVLLRDALMATGKIGIARVVMSNSQHLAAVKPHQGVLVLELMHFADEIVGADDVRQPNANAAGKREMDMAKHLIASMSDPWKPEAFKDDYQEQVLKIIDEKVKAGGKLPPAKPKTLPSGVIDLMAALEQSLASAGKKKAKAPVTVMKPKPKKKAG